MSDTPSHETTSHENKRRVAIIGSGISGLMTAYLLHHYSPKSIVTGKPLIEFTLFEKANTLGGHTATIDVNYQGEQHKIDTGFIVYNDWTYPNFIRLLDEIGVSNQTTEMSFSVSCETTGIEYSGNNINTLFSQRRNMVTPEFLKMLWQIQRFNKQAVEDLAQGKIEQDSTLRQYLQSNHYSGLFVTHYLAPMCAAIWSTSAESALDFPLLFFVRFFKNHGLLSINNRPQWRVVRGGSKAYIAPLIAGFESSIRVNTGITQVARLDEHVELVTETNERLHYDDVVFACHSDQALAMIDNPTSAEKSILGSIPYQENEVVLHTDASLLPVKKRAWAAWNYLLSGQQTDNAVLTYNMNILQSLQSSTTFCVSLNATQKINPAKIIGNYRYAHPQFSLKVIDAQRDWSSINGKNRSWFCGSYWANGFHEDGVVSAVRVAEAMGVSWKR